MNLSKLLILILLIAGPSGCAGMASSFSRSMSQQMSQQPAQSGRSGQVVCPYDGAIMWKNGKTTVSPYGIFLYQYTDYNNHVVWAR